MRAKSIFRSYKNIKNVLTTYETFQLLHWEGMRYRYDLPTKSNKLVRIRGDKRCEGCHRIIEDGDFALYYRDVYGVGGWGNRPNYWCVACAIQKGWLKE